MIDVILQGLAHMHECDFVHGDMKPENALLTSNSIVKLTDSGTSAAGAMKWQCKSVAQTVVEFRLFHGLSFSWWTQPLSDIVL